MKKGLLFAAVALLAAGCVSHKEYDLTNGINNEITLFEQEVSVPIGDFGPVSLGAILSKVSLPEGILPIVNEDGYLEVSGEDTELYRISVLEINQEIADKDEPYVFCPESIYASAPITVGLLGMLGFVFPQQSVVFYAQQPMKKAVPFTGTARLVGTDEDTYDEVIIAEQSLDGLNLASGSRMREIASISAGPGEYMPGTEIRIDDLSWELPANALDNLRSSSYKDFVFSAEYTSLVGIGPNLALPTDRMAFDVNLPLSRFGFKSCTLKTEVINSLPLRLEIKEITPLTEDEEPDPNISISGDIVIAGGTRAVPASSPLTLEIAAQNGSIPDITRLQIVFDVSAEPNIPVQPIHSSQGLSMKSSSVTVTGGITLNKK